MRWLYLFGLKKARLQNLQSRESNRNARKEKSLPFLMAQHFCSFAHLFAKLLRPGDIEMTFAASSQAATCYHQSNHSKIVAISLSTLPKDTKSELAGLSSH